MPIIITGGAGETGSDKFVQAFMASRKQAQDQKNYQEREQKNEERYQTELNLRMQEQRTAELQDIASADYDAAEMVGNKAGITLEQMGQATNTAISAFAKVAEGAGIMPKEALETLQNAGPESQEFFKTLSPELRSVHLRKQYANQQDQRLMQTMQRGAERLEVYIRDGLIDKNVGQELLARMAAGDKEAFPEVQQQLEQGAVERKKESLLAIRDRGKRRLLSMVDELEDDDSFVGQEIVEKFLEGDYTVEAARLRMSMLKGGGAAAVEEMDRMQAENAQAKQFMTFFGAAQADERQAGAKAAAGSGAKAAPGVEASADYVGRWSTLLADKPGAESMDTVVAELTSIYGSEDKVPQEVWQEIAQQSAVATEKATSRKETRAERKAHTEDTSAGAYLDQVGKVLDFTADQITAAKTYDAVVELSGGRLPTAELLGAAYKELSEQAKLVPLRDAKRELGSEAGRERVWHELKDLVGLEKTDKLDLTDEAKKVKAVPAARQAARVAALSMMQFMANKGVPKKTKEALAEELEKVGKPGSKTWTAAEARKSLRNRK